VVLLFKASSLDRAKAFMTNPAVGAVIQTSGIVGKMPTPMSPSYVARALAVSPCKAYARAS
jgi:hypothetical protein